MDMGLFLVLGGMWRVVRRARGGTDPGVACDGWTFLRLSFYVVGNF